MSTLPRHMKAVSLVEVIVIVVVVGVLAAFGLRALEASTFSLGRAWSGGVQLENCTNVLNRQAQMCNILAGFCTRRLKNR